MELRRRRSSLLRIRQALGCRQQKYLLRLPLVRGPLPAGWGCRACSHAHRRLTRLATLLALLSASLLSGLSALPSAAGWAVRFPEEIPFRPTPPYDLHLRPTLPFCLLSGWGPARQHQRIPNLPARPRSAVSARYPAPPYPHHTPRPDGQRRPYGRGKRTMPSDNQSRPPFSRDAVATPWEPGNH